MMPRWNHMMWGIFPLLVLVGSLLARQPVISVPQQQEKIRQLVKQLYRGQAIRVEVEFIGPLRPWHVEPGVDSLSAAYRHRRLPRGYAVFVLRAHRKGQIVRTRTVAVQVRPVHAVFRLKRSVKKGERIWPQDVVVDTVETSGIKGTLLSQLTAGDSLYARRFLKAGTILTREDVHPAYLVRVGEMATVLLQRSTLRIQMTMKALQNGSKGDRVWFMHPQTRKRIKGQVVDRSLAIVVP
ncbi:MAG: flagellar basal body P-ring formation protein FlgA [Calditrichaeota bacterium]|nr:flagellar basal body P-ring formation protein FlgA [Calditrichota bacterium]